MPAAIPAVIGAAGAIGGALINKKSAKDSAAAMSQQGQLDPRVAGTLFGTGIGSDRGLLGTYQNLLHEPRSVGGQTFANANEAFLGANGMADLLGVRNAAYQSMGGNSAPTAQAAQATGTQSAAAPQSPLTPGVQPGRSTLQQTSDPAWAVGSKVQAPGQNNIDLTGSYNSLLGGGNTGALMNSLQAGNALTSAQQQQNQSNMTDNLLRNVLPSVRGGAIAAGQYGGSRQGIAEGNALSDFTKQLNQSNTQIGLANSANTANALAGAYENGQNRALSATQGLGAQQYGVASQNANVANQAEFMNVNSANDILKTNTGIRQQNEQFNAGLYQQAGQYNAGQFQQNNQFNAGLQQQNNQLNANLGQQNGQFNAGQQQQTNLANLQSQLTTNAQNNSSLLGGAGLLSGLLGQVQGTVNQSDNWGLNRAQGVNSLLQPYLSGAPTQNPVSSNSGAAALGGGLAGLSLGNSLGGLLGGMGNNSGIGNTSPAGGLPTGWQPDKLPVQSFPMFSGFSSS